MFVAGIDLSTFAVDVVLLPLDSDEARWTRYELGGRGGAEATQPTPRVRAPAVPAAACPPDSFDRCRAVRSVLPSRGWWHDEGVIAVALERPSGHHVKSVATLMRVQGAILACLPTDLAVTEMVPAEWKRRTVGKGNATKVEVALWAEQQWAWPKGSVYIFVPQDGLDAFCLAYALRAMTSVEEAA